MPDPITLTNIRDSYVSQLRATKNYSSTARLKLAASGAGDERMAYLHFGKPYPPGVTILSAILRVYNAEAWNGTITLTAQKITDAWAASRVNYNNRPAVSATPYSITKSNAVAGTAWEIDITQIIQTVANGGVWKGIRLSVNGTTAKSLYSAQAENSSLRPQVEITWSDAPEAPEGLSPAGNRSTSLAKPILSFTFTDVSGDTNLGALNVQVDSVNTFNSGGLWDSGWVTASEPFLDLSTTSYPGMADGASVWWRVRVRDGSGVESVWSDPVQMSRTSKGTLTLSSPTMTVVATNRVTDPRATTLARWTGTRVSLAVGAGTVDGITTSIRATVTDGAAVQYILGGGSTAVAAGSNSIPVTAGQTYEVGLTVNPETQGASFAVQVYGYDSSGTFIANFTGSYTAVAQNASTRIRTAYTAPANVTHIRIGWLVSAALALNATLRYTRAFVVEPSTGVYFSGADTDTDVIQHDWTGTADASTSTMSKVLVDDTSPPVFWSLTGRTQAAYRVTVSRLETPASLLWDTGKVSATVNSIDSPDKLLSDPAATYLITLHVWDTVNREKTPNDPIYYEIKKQFGVRTVSGVAAPTSLTVAVVPGSPAVELTFQRSTAPDDFVILRDGVVVQDNVDPGTIFTTGTTYKWQDKTVPPRISHTWQVKAKVNRQESSAVTSAALLVRHNGTWLMYEDGTSPIILVKSAATPQPVVEAVSGSLQETHQPVGGGSPVLITQYLRGFEGHVEGVLSDDVVMGLSARTMRDRFKTFKSTPGRRMVLFNVDEALLVVVFNLSYRPRARSGGSIVYDVSFDFFEVE